MCSRLFDLSYLSYLLLCFILFLTGQVGDWKNHITAFINRRVEKMVQDNLSDTDLVFDYELVTKPENTEEPV